MRGESLGGRGQPHQNLRAHLACLCADKGTCPPSKFLGFFLLHLGAGFPKDGASGQCGRLGSAAWSEKIPWSRDGNPL